MLPMKRPLFVLASIAIFTLPANASAQDMPVLDLGPGIMSNAGDIALNQSLKNYYRSRGASARTSPNRFAVPNGRANAFARPQAGEAVSNASFTYTSTPALRKQAVAEFVQRAKQTQPEAASVGQQLTQHDYNGIWRGIAGRYGLSANDTADALTAYTVLGWLITNGADDTNAAAVRAARGQIAAQSAGNPQFQSSADRAKLGEEFKILFVVLHSGWQSAMREGTLDVYRNGVANMFAQHSGTDLRSLNLTSAGFVGR